jgi:hypothetical protein
MPLEQLMSCVGADEIVTSASAPAATSMEAAAIAVRPAIFLIDPLLVHALLFCRANKYSRMSDIYSNACARSA